MSITTDSSTGMSPIKQSERIQILDILRGFAIFGILAVNLAGFASPAFLPGYIHPESMPWYDSLAGSLVKFFAEGKFYTIFSFLFGLGFSVQMARAEARGRDMRSFYPRRLGILFGLGVLHAVLLWTGDILRIYALLGFALLAFRKRSNRTLIIWAVVLYALNFLFLILFHSGGEASIPGIDIIGMARQVYTGSSYLAIVFFQFFCSLATFFIIGLTQGPSALALFLLGLLAGRSRLFERLANNRSELRRIFWITMPVGLLGNSIFLFSDQVWFSSLGAIVGAPTLATAYITGISLLHLRENGARMLAPLATVGRMALTNYVLQSLVCSLLFGGFGFGLYEKMGAAGLLGLTFLIYLAQIPLSAWWLQRYQFGPLEWVWRSLTYHKRQLLRKAYA